MATPALTATGPDSRARWARLAVAAIFFTNGALIASWFVRTPAIKEALALGEGAFGLALLTMAIGALISQPLTGLLIGHTGSRIPTAVLAVLFCALMLLPGLATTLPLLMGALLVLGAVNGALDVSMNAQAALVEERYGRAIMSSFHGLWSVGGLIGSAVGGLAARADLPVLTHFALAALLGGVIMLAATRFLIPDGPAETGHGVALALPSRALLPMGVVALAALICEGAIGDWGAIYLREGLGSSAGDAAFGYSVFALMMAAGRFTGDWLSNHFDSGRIVRTGGVLMVLGIGLALAGTAPWVAIVGYGLVGAGGSCIFPLILSAAARTPGMAPGAAIAAMATAGYSGFLVGPPLIGGLAEILSLRGGLGVLALFALLIVVLGPTVRGQALAATPAPAKAAL